MTNTHFAHSIKNLEKARIALRECKCQCQFCKINFMKSNIKTHELHCKENPTNKKICPVCGKEFSSKSTTCSYSCSNIYFRSGKNNPNFNKNNYRRICFSFHKKECVICHEENILAVHHMDENHKNNDPMNLVPMCPTHHQYMHSRYKKLILQQVLNYINSISVCGSVENRRHT